MDSVRLLPSERLQLPNEPGVYRFFNKEQEIIYVGKAKDLKKRVSSYFNKIKHENRKTQRLVKEIVALEVTIVGSEYEALLLENNLIKQLRPRYNVMLRDDKSYPFICITKERFPQVFSTRRTHKNWGEYYGPFTNVKPMYTILDLVKKLFKLRNCKYNLSEENIQKKKYKVCLEYHIGNCKGPCAGLQSEQEYMADIEQIRLILKGKVKPVKEHFAQKMKVAAEQLAFEEAQHYKECLELLNNYHAKSLVVNPKLDDLDICTIVGDEKEAFINYIRIKSGMIILARNMAVQKKMNETNEDILTMAIVELRAQFHSEATEVLTNLELTWPINELTITLPKIGDKRKLVDMSLKNALFYKKEKLDAKQSKITPADKVLEQIRKDLRLKIAPVHIECFDNSNIQGTNPVASMVCFKKGKPSKKDYRKFHVKTVEGPDDFASMREIVLRRYKRQIEESNPLPDLIVIDGGKGQLSAACESLKELKLYGKIPIIGIAKRLEELYVPEDSLPLHIDKRSPSLKLLQRIRDEAHRFAITFHRDTRSQKSFQTGLEDIPGIGEKTADKLLAHFKSLKKIQEANEKEIAEVIGESKASLLIEFLRQRK